MRIALIAVVASILVTGCVEFEQLDVIDAELEQRLKAVSPSGRISHFILPDENDLSAVPQSPFNPLTPEKVALGKLLFFETGFAQDPKYPDGLQTYSCSSCHVPEAGFVPGRLQGIADGGIGFGNVGLGREKLSNYEGHEIDAQGARPLSVLNTAYVTNTMWNGKFGANHVNEGTETSWEKEAALHVNYLGMDGLESQNIEGMDLHRLVVNPETVKSLGYQPYFDAAFGDFPESIRYNDTTASFAISAYLRTLLTNQAPYQRWLRGEYHAMTETQKKGALLFYGKAGCFRCHKGPSMSAVRFYALGVRDLYENSGVFNTSADDKRNLGRGGFTGKEDDMYKFKVPQLYNLRDARFYFHGSSKNNMWGVVEYFNEAIPENKSVPTSQIASEFHPLNLSTIEIEALVDFLENGLFDPNLDRYVPETVPSGNCFPNNDFRSREDLGCL